MVYIDWKRIMAVKPETFDEDEKEALLETVCWFAPDAETSMEHLTSLLKVIQEILKYKNDQAESLLGALDELASKQGEEVARGRQELLDEMEDLKEQLEYYKRLDRDTDVSDDQLRSELVKLEMQNEELVAELQEREQELLAEKTESERVLGQLARLEREKSQLSRELLALQEETNDRKGRASFSESLEGSSEKIEELVEIIRQKNKHIMQLLDDIETLEEDNKTIRVKLSTTRKEHTEAQNVISDLTQQVTALKIELEDCQRKNKEAEETNAAVTAQVQELIEKKAKNDGELDEFAAKLYDRVEEWKNLLDSKDLEIVKLQKELQKLSLKELPWKDIVSDSDRKTFQDEEVLKLKETVEQLEKEIESLKMQLLESERKLTIDSKTDGSSKNFEIEEQLRKYKEQVKQMDEEAVKKAEEISNLIGQLRAYERGEFGLTEALEKVKKLEKKVVDREKKIESLVEACNKLDIEKGMLEDENVCLKEKLGMSPTRVIDSSSVKRNIASDKNTILQLRQSIDNLNAEIVELKLENRNLAKASSNKQESTEYNTRKGNLSETDYRSECHDVNHEEVIDLENRYICLVEENDALRKGMRKILESLEQGALGEIHVSCLEKLVEALDSRHVSGWYHPAMRLQAELHFKQGEYRQLLHTVAQLKKENENLSSELNLVRSGQGSKTNDGEDKDIDFQREFSPDTFRHDSSNLEMALKKSELDFERSSYEWDKEKRELIKEIDNLKVQLPHNGGNDLPSTNPDILAEMLELSLARETFLENKIDEVIAGYLNKEYQSLEQISKLEKEKAEYAEKIKNLENCLSRTVSMKDHDELKKEMDIVKVRIENKLFSCLLSSSKKKTESYTSSNINDCLLEELKTTKQKLTLAESQLRTVGKNLMAETFDKELLSISEKLAATEVQFHAEMSRKTHLEKVCETLKQDQLKMDQQLDDLNSKVLNLSESCAAKEESIIEMKQTIEQLALSLDKNQPTLDQEETIRKLSLEKKHLEELLEMSRVQCRSLMTKKSLFRTEKDVFKQCLRQLKGTNSGKLALVKLSQELVLEKTKNDEFQSQIDEITSYNSRLLSEKLEKEAENIMLIQKAENTKTKHREIITIIFKLYSKLARNPKLRNCALYQELDRIRDIENELEEKLQAVEKCETGLKLKEQELIVQLESLQDLKEAFESDAQNLVTWHNTSTDFRLKETRYKWQNEYLTSENQKLQGQIDRYKNEIAFLEESCVEKEWQNMNETLCKFISDSLGGKVMPVKDQKLITDLEKNIVQLQEENEMLVHQMEEKEADRIYHLSEKTRDHKPRSISPSHESGKEALDITINSLQALLRQKEETIARYQELVKKTREERSVAVKRIQDELKTMHHAFAMQSKSYSRLKHGAYQPAANDVERYVTKVQELEEEVAELQSTLGRVNRQLEASQRELESWRCSSIEKQHLLDGLDMELERCREEMMNAQSEAEQLRELVQGGQTNALLNTIEHLQKKLSERQITPTPQVNSQKPSDQETRVEAGEEKILKRQLKASREECARLREQVNNLTRVKKRPLSSTPAGKGENLIEKIKKLEEALQLNKKHEKELEEKGLKKIRSVEEVARWDERKRHQKATEKLLAKLKQKEAELNAVTSKLETLRGLFTKLKRDKAALEQAHRSGSARENSRRESWVAERERLESQLLDLQQALNDSEENENILKKKVQLQESQIDELKLALSTPRTTTDDCELLKKQVDSLESRNTYLEDTNRKLTLEVDTLRSEVRHLKDVCRKMDQESKASIHPKPSRAQVRTSYDLHREISKLKEQLKSEKDVAILERDRSTQLQEQMHRLQSQIALWEERDLVENLSKRELQDQIRRLQQEHIEVKATLAHKIHLLDRVKILLSKAAAKEKALNDKVSVLQSMVAS